MNRIAPALLIFAAACAAGARAESPLPGSDAFQSSKSRAEVQAELASSGQAGSNPWSIAYDPLRGFQGSASRELLQADYRASRDEVRALSGEDSGSAWLKGRRPAAASSALAALPGVGN